MGASLAGAPPEEIARFRAEEREKLRMRLRTMTLSQIKGELFVMQRAEKRSDKNWQLLEAGGRQRMLLTQEERGSDEEWEDVLDAVDSMDVEDESVLLTMRE